MSIFSRVWSHTDNQTRLIFSLIIGLVAVLWILIRWTKKSTNTNPSLPPGPKGLPLVGNLLTLGPELHKYFTELAKTYGPIYTLKLGRKTGIVISSPEIAKEVLKDQDTTFANRDAPVAGIEGTYGGSNIVWAPYGPEWRMLRKVCVREMVSNGTLDSVYRLRRREVRDTVRYLYSKAGSPVDVGNQMFLTVMNVITSMLWGSTMEGEERAGLGAEFRHIVGEFTGLLGAPNISDFIPALERFDLQGIQKKMKGLRQRLDTIFEVVIEQKSKMNGEKSRDFLQIMLEMKDNGDAKTPFTINHVKAILMDMVVGGTDTTSNTMEFALAEIMNNPKIMERVHEELQEVVGKDNIVEESHISNLPYLRSVMKETLRLHTALPLLVPHSPSATSIVSGYTIPSGARVFLNVWAIHRDPSIWDDPLEFMPERFSDGSWDFSGNDFKYFPFGSGRRMCAGIDMAERMFLYTLASLVHSFEWSLPAGEKLDMEGKFGIALKKKLPLVAIPTPRLSSPSLYK